MLRVFHGHPTCVCLTFEADNGGLSEDAGSEEAEDTDFWEGVTKPGSSKTTASQQENRVQRYLLEFVFPFNE